MKFCNIVLKNVEMEESDDASLPKRGRPSVKTAHIRLRIEVFQEWTKKKEDMGYSNKTHSEFAEMLLQYCDQEKETGQCIYSHVN